MPPPIPTALGPGCRGCPQIHCPEAGAWGHKAGFTYVQHTSAQGSDHRPPPWPQLRRRKGPSGNAKRPAAKSPRWGQNLAACACHCLATGTTSCLRRRVRLHEGPKTSPGTVVLAASWGRKMWMGWKGECVRRARAGPTVERHVFTRGRVDNGVSRMYPKTAALPRRASSATVPESHPDLLRARAPPARIEWPPNRRWPSGCAVGGPRPVAAASLVPATVSLETTSPARLGKGGDPSGSFPNLS